MHAAAPDLAFYAVRTESLSDERRCCREPRPEPVGRVSLVEGIVSVCLQQRRDFGGDDDTRLRNHREPRCPVGRAERLEFDERGRDFRPVVRSEGHRGRARNVVVGRHLFVDKDAGQC